MQRGQLDDINTPGTHIWKYIWSICSLTQKHKCIHEGAWEQKGAMATNYMFVLKCFTWRAAIHENPATPGFYHVLKRNCMGSQQGMEKRQPGVRSKMNIWVHILARIFPDFRSILRMIPRLCSKNFFTITRNSSNETFNGAIVTFVTHWTSTGIISQMWSCRLAAKINFCRCVCSQMHEYCASLQYLS